MSTLSTHVLDTSLGKPAQGIRVTLEKDGETIGSGVTDADGRVSDLLKEGSEVKQGTYSLKFFVADYFSTGGREAFYDEIVVTFLISVASRHYHVPLLLSPFGYSTYRGS